MRNILAFLSVICIIGAMHLLFSGADRLLSDKILCLLIYSITFGIFACMLEKWDKLDNGL